MPAAAGRHAAVERRTLPIAHCPLHRKGQRSWPEQIRPCRRSGVSKGFCFCLWTLKAAVLEIRRFRDSALCSPTSFAYDVGTRALDFTLHHTRAAAPRLTARLNRRATQRLVGELEASSNMWVLGLGSWVLGLGSWVGHDWKQADSKTTC